MSGTKNSNNEASSADAGITFIGDGWSEHELGADEGAGVWIRGLASYQNPDGSETIFVAGSQGNVFIATVPPETSGGIGSIAFTPVSREGALGTIPAFKFFNGVSFGGAQPGTLGFVNGYHGLLLETTDGGKTWTDLTDPEPNAPLQADIRDVGISPIAGVIGNGTTPVLVAASLNPGGTFYPPLHYGTIGADGTITWNASALYQSGSILIPENYYDLMTEALYLSDTLVLASGSIAASGSMSQSDYPLLLSTDGGASFSQILNFPQAPLISEVHELVADPTHAGLVWAAGSDGRVLSVDLSSYLSGGPGNVVFSESGALSAKSINGVAVSPDDQTIVAIASDGAVFRASDTAGVGSVGAASLQWTPVKNAPTITEAWSAQFVTDTTVLLIGKAAPSVVTNGNTVQASNTDMVWVSTDAGQDWSSINLDAQWSTQQTALTGTIDASTAANVNHLTINGAEVSVSQGTLLLTGATLDVIGTTATAAPAMILLPPGSGLAAVSVDTQGNTLTLNSVLSGPGELVKTGLGTLDLAPVRLYDPDFNPQNVYSANFQSGGIEIDDGVLAVQSDAALGIPNANYSNANYPEVIYPDTGSYALTLNGGTLQALQNLTLQTVYYAATLTRPVILGDGGGTFDTKGNQITLPGSISGSGGLTEAGGGILALGAANDFAGGVSVEDGILALQATGALPTGASLTVSASGSVQLDGSIQDVSEIAGSTEGDIALDGGQLVVQEGAAGPGIDFGSGSGELVFATRDLLVLTTGLTSIMHGFGSSARINFEGLSYSSNDTLEYLQSEGVLSIDNGNIALAVLQFDPTTSYAFHLQPDVGNTLTLTNVACFVAGTRISTQQCLVAVEALRVGDLVTVLDGSQQPIIWIGRCEIACGGHPRPEQVWPVRVKAHAFGRGLPALDLLLSPDHAVFAMGALIPVKHLTNDKTIVQEYPDRVVYYHIELPRHNVVLAEGLPVESYLATGDRPHFKSGTAMVRDACACWESHGFAPLVVTGAKLDAVKAHVRRQLRKSSDRRSSRYTVPGNVSAIAPVRQGPSLPT